MGFLDKIVEWIKLPAIYLFAIALFTAFLLFGGDYPLKFFDLKPFVQSFKPWISIVFLLSSSLLLTHSLVSIFKFIKYQIQKRIWIGKGKRRLHQLTTDEKSLLRSYIVDNTRTQYLSLISGIVNTLENEFIIYRASEMGRLHTFAYNIHHWAWRYLRRHPNLISGGEDLPELQFRQRRRRF